MIARLITIAAALSYRYRRALFVHAYIAAGESERLIAEREAAFELGRATGQREMLDWLRTTVHSARETRDA